MRIFIFILRFPPGYGDRCDAQHAEVNGRPKGYLAKQIALPLESLHPLAHISLTHALTALIPQQISPVFTPSYNKETEQRAISSFRVLH